ncbi:MAG: polymer-forming cytoskeletal protein [Fidelibacterota bacterium]
MAKDSLKHVETMIGEEAVVRGDVVLKGGAIVAGKIYGNLRTDGPVRITRSAFIKGDVNASHAYVGGTVEGNLTTTGRVVLRSGSAVKGDIVYRQLVIEEGAQFEGRCDLASASDESPARSRDREEWEIPGWP